MKLDEFLRIRSKKIQAEIDLNLKNFQKQTEKINPNLKKLTKEFLESFKNGKNLRGILVEIGFEIASKKSSTKEILKIASSYEIFHSSILVHDDIIDQSLTRRGIKTLFKRLGGNHYGSAQAISLGDIGFFLAINLISKSNFKPELKVKALEFFSKTIMDTSIGEVLDVEAPNFSKKYEVEDIETIQILKTARYSLAGPLILGAILAGADEKLIKNLEEFGLNLGLAFQIQDDYLGVFGNSKDIGKSNISDIEEGKATLLIGLAFKNGNINQRKILNQFYGKPNLSLKEIEAVKEVFLETKAAEGSKDEAKNYIKKAKLLIPKIIEDKKLKQILEKFSDYLIERRK